MKYRATWTLAPKKIGGNNNGGDWTATVERKIKTQHEMTRCGRCKNIRGTKLLAIEDKTVSTGSKKT